MRKFIHGARLVLVLGAVLVSSCSTPLPGVPGPSLDKPTAQQILESMGYTDVNVGAIVLGATRSALGSSSSGSMATALVLGVGERNGKAQKLEFELHRDAELGWFYFRVH